MEIDQNKGLNLILPDIARETRVDLTGELDRVGMTFIEVPILLLNDQGSSFFIPAKVSAFVNLKDPQAKGIHMSRLYLQLQEGLAGTPLSFSLLARLLEKFIETHKGLSDSSFVQVEFEYMLERPALVSSYKGWRSYPLVLSAHLENGKVNFDLHLKITYSSTCPCSAALARKLIQDHFVKDFTEETVKRDEVYQWLGTTDGVLATPHSQRSVAEVQLRFVDPQRFDSSHRWKEVIDRIEKKLGTPVQAAVKREDEQEFALLNGQNLMFCEDAARKIKNAMEELSFLGDYRIKVSHEESLHPHNAVSIVTKGVPGGLIP